MVRQIIGTRELRRITGEVAFSPQQFARLNRIAEAAIRLRPQLVSPRAWDWNCPTQTLTAVTRNGLVERSF